MSTRLPISLTLSHLVIFCPLAFERAGIRRALTRLFITSRDLQVKTTPRVILAGPGPVAIERAVESFFARFKPADEKPVAVLAGVAGELAPGSSDVHVFTEVTSEDGNHWHSPLKGAGDAGLVILGLNQPACTPEEKARWREETGATFVDTESHAFARCCQRLKLRWAIVRGASDRRHEYLPRESLQWVTPRGRTRITRVLKDLTIKPSLLAAMIRLGRNGNRVLPVVAQRVAELSSKIAAANPVAAALRLAPGSVVTPLPEELAQVAARVPLVILLGGSFDPPHLAHVELATAVRAELEREIKCEGLGWLVYIPAARSPFKSAGPAATDADRIAMLKLALLGVERSCLWTDEIDRARVEAGGTPTPSFTIDTAGRFLSLLYAVGRCGPDSLTTRLLIGQDQAAAFHRWREFKALIRLAEPVVMLRRDASEILQPLQEAAVPAAPGETQSLMLALKHSGAWNDAELDQWQQRIAKVAAWDVSSTEIRRRLAVPQSDPGTKQLLKEFIRPEVLEYIREKGLYTGENH
ncbi:MAG: hypothetical protein H7210_08755 [Pyrinomonadaceae bacterium]|nr:hypothetical protein [Phycisphaerales bacterium]